MTIMLMVTNYWRTIMKHKIHLLYLFMVLGLNLLLTACLTMPLVVEGEMPTPMVTLVVAEPSAEPSAMPETTETAELTATATAQPTHTPTITIRPTITARAEREPHLITQAETTFREGPGLTYAPYFVMGPDATAPILGRNGDGTWLATYGPGGGPGPRSWVAAAEVMIVNGNINDLPILPAPILPPTPVPLPDVPLVGETGSPPAERCIVSHPGEGGAINIHLGPGEQFALVARLDKGRWAESIQEQVGWYEIRIGPGEVGWVNGTAVALNENC
jgi:hypothetical protein